MTDYTNLVAQMVRNEADMAFRRRVHTIFEWLDPADSDIILDGGCGRGFYLTFLRYACAARLIGVELERPYLRLAQVACGNDPTTSLANANLYALPFRDNSIDKAILSEVLEHVDDDAQALRAVARVVKPKGLIAITVPNANYPFWWDPINRTLENLFKTHIRTGPLAGIWANHVRLYTSESLCAAVLSAGLEIVDARSFTHASFPFIHNMAYGLGKPLLESGFLPSVLDSAASRYNLSGKRGSLLNPINLGLTLFEWFDRPNVMNEPPDKSTVNLCILARKPA